MSEPSEAAKQRYSELTGYKWRVDNADRNCVADAFARYIAQVSDAAKLAIDASHNRATATEALAPFILPDPPEDPLEEFVRDLGIWCGHEQGVERVRSVLAKRGLKIVEAQP